MTRNPRYRPVFRAHGHGAGDVDEEFQFHLDARTAELVAAGWPADAARAEALRRFGDVEDARRFCERADIVTETHMVRTEYLQHLAQDLAYAVRTLRRTPAFTVVAILTLALGVGANTGIFATVYGALLRPLPYGNAGGIAAVSLQAGYSTSKARLELMRERQRAFDGLAAYSRWGGSLTGDGDPEVLRGAVSTANLFDVLQARAAIGRTFRAGEDAPGANRVIVLGHAFWERRFAGDSSIVGRSLSINGHAHTVIGVMPASFDFPVRGTQFWTPVALDRADSSDYAAGYLLLVGRLRQGVSYAGATSDMRRVVRDLRVANLGGFSDKDELGATAVPVRDMLMGRVAGRLELLFAAGILVLVMAGANVANLAFARGVAREREFAVRTSIGATRGRIFRQLLTESVLLACAGGAVGIIIAATVSGVAAGLVPPEVIGGDARLMAGPVLAFTFAVTLVVGIAFGVAPAWQAARGAGATALRATRGSAGRHAHRAMRALIVGECALAFMLAVSALLLARSFRALSAEAPGFVSDGVLAFRIEPPEARYGTPEAIVALLDGVMSRLHAIPGVVDAGGIHLLPLGDGNWNPSLRIRSRTLPPGAELPEIDWRLATSGYLTTMRIPVIRGRWFTDADRAGAPLVAVISEAAARRDFPNTDPIGQEVRTFFEGKGNWATIVGVVGDTKDQSLAGPARPQLYRPFGQWPTGGMVLLLRARGNPASLGAQARKAVWSVDPNVPVADMRPLDDVVRASIAQPRMMTSVFGVFGLLAVVLGVVGIYGLVAYSVSQRTLEFGVRMAFGARAGQIAGLVLRDAVSLSVVGVVIGAAASVGLTRFLQDQLYTVRPLDGVAFATGAVLLVAISVAAAMVPVRRAVAVSPTEAIRCG